MEGQGIKKNETIIQIVVFKDQLLGLTDSSRLVRYEEYTEVQGEERAPSIDEKRKGLDQKKTRWINF